MKLELFLLLILFIISGCLGQEKAKSLVSNNPAAFDRTSGNGSGEASSLGFVITAVTPSAGSFTGNYNITISGSRFDSFTVFTIDGVSCLTLTIVSSSSAICQVPGGSVGAKDVTATKPGFANTMTGGFQYMGAATVISVLPTTVPATIPTLITVSGTNLVSGATVSISHPSLPLLPCQPVTVAANGLSLTCYTPALTPAQSHSIALSGITSSVLITNPDTTQISLPNSLTLTPAPKYTSMSFGASGVTAPPIDGVLNNGVAGYTLIVNGSYLTAGATITVNGSAAGACSYVSSTTMSCTSLPSVASQGTYSFVITNTDGQLTTESILFVDKPSITTTTPVNMNYSAGDIVTLNGTGLGLNPAITIYNNANTVLLGACPLSTSIPVSCSTPVLGSDQATTVRLTNDYGYRTTYNPLNFITATTLAFSQTHLGRVVQGSTFNHTMVLTNPSLLVSATAISINTTAIAAPFSYVSTTCGATLAPATSCNIVLQFSPTSLGLYSSGNIIVNYTNGISATSLTGSLSAVGIALDTLVPSLDFGTIPYGNNHLGAATRFTKPVVLINRGRSTVTLNSGTFTDATHFLHTGGTFPGSDFGANICGLTIAAGARCLVSLDFRPTSTGAKSTTYTLTYNTIYSKAVSVQGTAGSATSTSCNPALAYDSGSNGTGTALDPYLVCNEAHFLDVISDTQADVAGRRVARYLQTADITFTANLTNPVWGNTGFVYNGGGYRLINPTINQPAITHRGIFYGGYVTNAIVSTVQAYNISVIGNAYTAGLMSYHGTLNDSFAYGTVSGGTFTGGLRSSSDAGIITDVTNSYFVGSVTCTGNYCGGISGYASSVSNSFTFGQVTGQTYTGGLVGANTVGNSSTNLYSSANVSGTTLVGGIIGAQYVAITNAHSYGTIVGSDYIGGISGAPLLTASISKSSFMGEIDATGNNVGGITGGMYAFSTQTLSVSESVSSGIVKGLTSVGGVIGGVAHVWNSNVIYDSFSLSTINVTGSNAGGIVGNNTVTGSVSRSYVAYPNGKSLFTISGSNKFVIGVSIPSAAGVFYLEGIHTDQTTPVGIIDLTSGQLQTQNILEVLGLYDFTPVTGPWKYSTLLPAEGYPYPMLQWMPDDWMP